VAAKKVPWRSWDEWLLVARLIKNGSLSSSQSACRIMRLWSTRGKVPIAVELSRNIIEARLLDANSPSLSGSGVGSGDNIQMLSLAYGLSISRFVNLMTDVVQRGAVAARMETLANSVEIPAWIVQIRHNSAHGASFPSLELMRKAADYLLNDFIIPKYWNAQHDLVFNSCTEPVDYPVPGSYPIQTSESIQGYFSSCPHKLMAGFPDHLKARFPEMFHWLSTHARIIIDGSGELNAAMSTFRIMLSTLDDCNLKILLTELIRHGRIELIAAIVEINGWNLISVTESLYKGIAEGAALGRIVELVRDRTRYRFNNIPNGETVPDNYPFLLYCGEAFRYGEG
jgi:hypothetical protein